MSESKKQVFISYNHQDADVANGISDELRMHDLEPWLDVEKISPGDRVADRLQEGLSASDYYVLLISENSNKSQWVKRELSLAFELANRKKLAIVPLLLDNADVPLELRGLLYIDFRQSAADGLGKLHEFFRSQFSRIGLLEPTVTVRKSPTEAETRRRACEEYLRNLQVRELRFLLSDRLTREQVAVIWFDVFERRMSDEISAANLALCCVELLDRARREGILFALLDAICRNHPHLSRSA